MRVKKHGFTLVEVIMVVLMIGILSVLSVSFIKVTFDNLTNANVMSELSGDARIALNNMEYDIKSAVSNSIRTKQDVANNQYLELVRGYEVLKYSNTDVTSSTDKLNLLMPVNPNTKATCSNGAAANCYVVIRNKSHGNGNGNSIYHAVNAGKHVISTVGFTVTTDDSSNADRGIVFNTAGQQFTGNSSNKRITIVEKTGVTYRCDLEAKTLSKYWGYDYLLEGNQPAPPAGTPEIIAKNVYGCGFTYVDNLENHGANNQNGVLSIYLRLKDPKSNASVTVYKQISVINNTVNNSSPQVVSQEMGVDGQVYEQ